MTMRFCIVIAVCYFNEIFAQECKKDEHAILGMMLRRHTFKTMKSSIAVECNQACNDDFRCHSFNYVISEELCELNNRTKEARPENFVPNSARYYVKSNKERGQGRSDQRRVLALLHHNGKNCSCFLQYGKKGFFLFLLLAGFGAGGRRGRFGSIQTFTVPRTTRYLIKAWGARGGTHSYDYGDYPGTYYGGKGAFKEGKFRLNKGTVLNIVVGQRGGDSVEVRGGQSTRKTAAQLGKSVEDNAGTGGGGGSFVYTTDNVLLLAAGGGGGASGGYNGVDGQAGSSGTSSVGKESSQVRNGGTDGQSGQCNRDGASYHGGVGAGWFGQGCTRQGSSHGERGGSRTQGWIGGQAGSMNSGNNGGPAPGAVGGFGGGGGGSEDNGASGGGGGYSGEVVVLMRNKPEVEEARTVVEKIVPV
ncbi:unnamed protein product [Pocillopora meandrina]|uniref:receptor protein-tyrosine kinase n=1 Tax=Pocillopora meandrina TaxID=46732 RepID=A0AAU9Y5F0_9CNID|nr:unnamed protein product [Pocillopora meandrina]